MGGRGPLYSDDHVQSMTGEPRNPSHTDCGILFNNCIPIIMVVHSPNLDHYIYNAHMQRQCLYLPCVLQEVGSTWAAENKLTLCGPLSDCLVWSLKPKAPLP